MSYHQLQRVVVRMLYDPAFVAQIFADATTALRDEDLTDQERRWLVEVDRRAYAVDPLRRTRIRAGRRPRAHRLDDREALARAGVARVSDQNSATR